MATPETLTLRIFFTEFNRINKSNYRLLLTLSVLFLIPSSTCLAIYPIAAGIYHRLFACGVATISGPLFACGVATIAGLLFTCGVATITDTIYHGFSNRSITLGSAIKSLLHSFLPIVFSTLIALILATFSTFLFVFALEFIKKGLSHSFLPLIFVTILILLLIPLQVHCALAIAVNKSNSSFESLWLSTRKLFSSPIGLKFLLFFILQGLNIDCFLWDEPALFKLGWPFVLFPIFNTIFNTCFYAYMMFLNISSVTVFYTTKS